MKRRDALKLHNRDEVFYKSLKQHCLVLGDPIVKGKYVYFCILLPSGGMLCVDHKEID